MGRTAGAEGQALSSKTHVPVPGEGDTRQNRLQGLDPLTGLIAGVSTGAAGAARPAHAATAPRSLTAKPWTACWASSRWPPCPPSGTWQAACSPRSFRCWSGASAWPCTGLTRHLQAGRRQSASSPSAAVEDEPRVGEHLAATLDGRGRTEIDLSPPGWPQVPSGSAHRPTSYRSKRRQSPRMIMLAMTDTRFLGDWCLSPRGVPDFRDGSWRQLQSAPSSPAAWCGQPHPSPGFSRWKSWPRRPARTRTDHQRHAGQPGSLGGSCR